MKNLLSLLIVALASLPVAAWSQTAIPKDPRPSVRTPSDPGMRNTPDSSMKRPSDPGVVIVPPNVDRGAVATPPKNIDPEMTGVTKEIDRENHRKSRDKQKSK